MIKWLLEHGADPKLAMGGGWRAIHLAARLGHESCLLMLLQEVRRRTFISQAAVLHPCIKEQDPSLAV